MAHQIKTDIFTLYLNKKRSKEEAPFNNFIQFDSISNKPTQTNFLDFFKYYIESFNGNFAIQTNTGNALGLDSSKVHFNQSENIIYGTIQGGKSGVGSYTYKNKKLNSTPFVISPEDISSKPFFFLLWIPDDSNVGIAIIQGFSSDSVTNLFCSHLKYFFSKNTKQLNFLVKKFVPSKIIEYYRKNAIIKEISISKRKLSGDKASKLAGVKYNPSNELDLKLVIKGIDKTVGLREKAFDSFLSRSTKIIEIDYLNGVEQMWGSHPEIAINFELDNQSYTAKSIHDFDISPSIYLKDGEVETDLMKHPTYKSIRDYCFKLLTDLKKEIGYIENVVES